MSTMSRALVVWVVATLAGTTYWQVPAASSQQPSAVAAPGQAPPASNAATPERALLNRYCVGCHNQRLKTAGLALDSLDLAQVSAASDVWEKVVWKLRGGIMPPVGRPRPDHDTIE